VCTKRSCREYNDADGAAEDRRPSTRARRSAGLSGLSALVPSLLVEFSVTYAAGTIKDFAHAEQNGGEILRQAAAEETVSRFVPHRAK